MGSTPILELPPPFEEALRRHDREIMRYLLRTTGDREDALDLFQETWLRAYRAYPQLDSAAGLRPWLFRIATNLCLNRTRDRARRSKQRQALVMRKFGGLDYGEIASALGCSAEAARADVYQAMKKLKAAE
jgi:RNA polymerase sigma-70 factor (ECF subfamily)